MRTPTGPRLREERDEKAKKKSQEAQRRLGSVARLALSAQIIHSCDISFKRVFVNPGFEETNR